MNYNIYSSSNNASSQFQTVNPNPTHEYASGNGQYVNQPIQNSNQKLQPIPTTVGNVQPYVSQQVPTGQQYYPMSYEQPSNPQQTMQYNFVNMGLNHGLNDPNMMAMMNMNRNMDMYVTLLSRSTLAYCSHCNAVVMTRLETPKTLLIFLAVFFSCFALIPILGFVNAEYLAYVMPVIFIVIVILFVTVFVTSFKTKHFCPVCKQYIGKTRDSIRIPARSEP